MRADRLLAIMLLLQRGGRMTASDLAEAPRGVRPDDLPRSGGPGRRRRPRLRRARTQRRDPASSRATPPTCPALGSSEAELVPLLGLSDASPGIALGSSLRRTETKLLMALPDDQRVRAEQARRRIHVDLSRWWDHAEAVAAPAHAGPGGLRGPAAAVALQARPGRVSRRPDCLTRSVWSSKAAPGTSLDARGPGDPAGSTACHASRTPRSLRRAGRSRRRVRLRCVLGWSARRTST